MLREVPAIEDLGESPVSRLVWRLSKQTPVTVDQDVVYADTDRSYDANSRHQEAYQTGLLTAYVAIAELGIFDSFRDEETAPTE